VELFICSPAYYFLTFDVEFNLVSSLRQGVKIEGCFVCVCVCMSFVLGFTSASNTLAA
jgi:hypothetical protein